MCQALQQEKHVLQRKMDMNELAFGQREAELVADLAAAKTELERHHTQGRDRRRDECGQLTQLSSHNQRLVEQLAEVSLRDEVVKCVRRRSDRKKMQPSRFGVAAMRAFEQCSFSTLYLPLTQAVTLEHSLRTELRSLREEMEESSFSRNINFKQLESIQTEVSVPAILNAIQCHHGCYNISLQSKA